jgi:cysteine synthase
MLVSFEVGRSLKEVSGMSSVINPEIVDTMHRARAVARARELGMVLPTFSQLANPASIPAAVSKKLAEVAPDEARAENLWRLNWYNAANREHRAEVPGYIVIPEAITGVKAPIVVLLGRRFPMIGAHKVLPAYSGLASLLVTGRFDPESQKAIWPSTGNYCRGGVSVSRILGCRGVAVLPAGMSRERFEWLEQWVTHPEDIVRTPGTESNVKEIYDKCAELERDPQNVILNQFSAFSNYLIHYACTGAAADHAFTSFNRATQRRLAAFVSATGSAGTIAAGDYLKKRHGTRIAAVEALECPTMLNNGYGEHNIQGIGDKHIPFIHNVMNTDFVIGVSDRVTDQLNLLFNSDVGYKYLKSRRKLDAELIASFADVGISGFANIVASIKLAKQLHYGPDDVIVTVATDSASLYDSERDDYQAKHFGLSFDEVNAGEIFGSCLTSIATDNVIELTHQLRRQIFNLGYYTWVEQQEVSVEDFERRRFQSFWDGIADSLPKWDRLIDDFNAEVSGSNKLDTASKARS